jgi:hypothetical protein
VPAAGALVAVWVLAEASRTAQITGAIWLAIGAAIEGARRR